MVNKCNTTNCVKGEFDQVVKIRLAHNIRLRSIVPKSAVSP
jgi:hypothetical protein